MMKKMVKLVSATLLAMFIFAGFAMGQNESTQLKTKRIIKLNGDSEKEKINFKVKEKTQLCRVKILSQIDAGYLEVEMYDPTNENRSHFLVASQINLVPARQKNGKNKDEKVHGEIRKRFKAPLAGNWEIRINPNKAKGSVLIEIQQSYEEKKQNE